MAHSNVLVLMATYDGELYVRQMIDSVIEQDYPNIHLVLSDDGSKDGTVAILEEYADKYPEVVTHYRSGIRFGNAQDHFMHLLSQFSDAPYIMFCDQDDVWHTDKVSKTMKKMREIEVDGVPALVHTDLRVVDRELKEMDPSFMHFSKLKGDRLALNRLLVQNVVTGCTVMVNKALAELAASHIPEGQMMMHDWWLALLAAAMGTIGYLDEATVDYRQHSRNVVGAKNTRSLKYIVQKIKNNGVRLAMANTYAQAQLFADSFRTVLDDRTRKIVEEYADMGNRSYLSRRIACLKYGYLKCGFQRIVAQMIWG